MLQLTAIGLDQIEIPAFPVGSRFRHRSEKPPGLSQIHCGYQHDGFADDIAIPTNLGNVRNYLVASSGDAVIAIGGRWGTLNEISYCMVSEKPLILMKGTGGCVDQIINGNIMQDIESHYFIADSAEEAVEKAFNL